MGRFVTPRVAALLVAGVLGAVVLVAVLGGHLGGTGQPGPTPTASSGTLTPAGGSPTAIAGNPSDQPTPGDSAAPNPTRTPYPSPSGPPRPRALADREILGFLPYWKLGRPDTQLPMGQLTTVAIFGVEAGKDGKLVRKTASGRVPQGWAGWQSAATDEVLRTAHAHGVRVVLTIQRFSWTDGQARKTVALLSDAQHRATLAGQIAAEVTSRGADGVNLDFEPLPSELRDDYTSFVRELRIQLDKARPGLQLTFDTTAAVDGWDLPALTADDAADAVVVLGYDYRVATANVAGSLDPISSAFGGSLTDTIDATLADVSPDRAILALPWYGRAWSTFSDQAGSATLDQATYGNSVTTEYGDAITLARLHGRNYDVQQASAWTAYRKKDCATCPETWRQLWYDDVDSMQAKQKLIWGQGMRGLGIWVLGYDHALPDLWATVAFSMGSGTDSQAPTGTAKVDPASTTHRHGSLPVVNGPLVLNMSADDGNKGTGVAFVRVSLAADLATDGSFPTGITYPWEPAIPSLSVDLTDQRLSGGLGGSGFAAGKATVYVQWRDIAGNWSAPLSVAFWLPAAVSPSPSPLP